MEIVLNIYDALVKHLNKRIPELGNKIEWHNAQEKETGGTTNFKTGHSAWIGFGRINSDAFQNRVHRCDIPFYVLLVSPAQSPNFRTVLQRHSQLENKIFREMEGFSCTYSYLSSEQPENIKNQQLLTSVHRTSINTNHNYKNTIATRLEFRTTAVDYSACPDYTPRQITPEISGNFIE